MTRHKRTSQSDIRLRIPTSEQLEICIQEKVSAERAFFVVYSYWYWCIDRYCACVRPGTNVRVCARVSGAVGVQTWPPNRPSKRHAFQPLIDLRVGRYGVGEF